jgi:hypothetical protein
MLIGCGNFSTKNSSFFSPHRLPSQAVTGRQDIIIFRRNLRKLLYCTEYCTYFFFSSNRTGTTAPTPNKDADSQYRRILYQLRIFRCAFSPRESSLCVFVSRNNQVSHYSLGYALKVLMQTQPVNPLTELGTIAMEELAA